MTPPLVSRSSHPRLSLVVLIGLGLVGLGSAIVGIGTLSGGDSTVLGLRVGIIGILLVIAGVSGYIAIAVFETHPDA